jgi:hypothetical protein
MRPVSVRRSTDVVAAMSRPQLAEVVERAMTVLNPARSPIKAAPVTRTPPLDRKCGENETGAAG